MRIKSGQDWATGLLFILVGAAAYWIGADYAMGTPQRPGTGVLPRILAWCLMVIGGLIWIQALLTRGRGLSGLQWRPVVMVTLATVAFARLVDPLGLVVTMVVSMTLCALATPETRWKEFAIFSLIMLAIGVGTFIKLLGMPISVWPTKAPEEVTLLLGLLKGGW